MVFCNNNNEGKTIKFDEFISYADEILISTRTHQWKIKHRALLLIYALFEYKISIGNSSRNF